MRLLARLVAVAGLVVAGGLTLPGGAAQAAACSGTSGVTVVIDYGSSSTTLCAPDASSAGAVLDSVSDVDYVPMYGQGVVCRINTVPANQSCQRMPPGSAYWAFFHAPRGGSWTYSNDGVAGYDPAPGTVVGFAFGAGAAPSSAPPAATASTPKPSPKPSPSSSSSSKPPVAKPKPAGTTPARPGSSGTSGSTSASGTSTTPGSSASATLGAKRSSTAVAPNGTPSTTSGGSVTDSPNGSTGSDETTAAAADGPDSGTPMTLLAGLGLVGLVGAGAAYLAVRRRATT